MKVKNKPTRVFLYSSKFSEGGKALALALGIKRIRLGATKFRETANKVVINWGSKHPFLSPRSVVGVVNHWSKHYTSKVDFFQKQSALDLTDKARLVPHTLVAQQAQEWLVEKHKVVARTVINGHSGQGIVMMEKPSDFIEAPLYTQYVPKRSEFRIHIIQGEVIFVQQKKRKSEFPEEQYNPRVRTHGNGWVFCHEDVLPPVDVIEQSVKAFNNSGLDFGAVDCIWNDKRQEAYVLEINTAPGLEGLTVQKYAEAFKRLFGL